MTCRVRWENGGEAVVASVAGEAIVLRSTVSSPPGSRVAGIVEGPAPSPPVALRVKVHACRRQAEGDFVLEARLLDATREVRQRLTSAARPG